MSEDFFEFSYSLPLPKVGSIMRRKGSDRLGTVTRYMSVAGRKHIVVNIDGTEYGYPREQLEKAP